MRAALISIGSVVFSLALVAPAAADGFDEAAKKAKPIHNAKGMSALFWSQQAACTKMKSDLLRRQCQGVRASRKLRVAKQTYVLDVAGPAIELKANAKNKSVEVTVRACVACEDEGPVIMGQGANKGLLAAALKSSTKSFKDLANAEHWHKYIGSRLRAQFLVKVPAAVEKFKVGGRDGYKVNVIGFRLYDPCQGEVLSAKPASSKGPVEVESCKDEPEFKPDEPKVPVNTDPDRLSPSQIKTAMRALKPMTDKCLEYYGIEGKASYKLVIAANGSVKSMKQLGDFADTPTGICLDKVVKTVSFPKSKKKETPISYPIVLR